jgi:hypothetical protein
MAKDIDLSVENVDATLHASTFEWSGAAIEFSNGKPNVSIDQVKLYGVSADTGDGRHVVPVVFATASKISSQASLAGNRLVASKWKAENFEAIGDSVAIIDGANKDNENSLVPMPSSNGQRISVGDLREIWTRLAKAGESSVLGHLSNAAGHDFTVVPGPYPVPTGY